MRRIIDIKRILASVIGAIPDTLAIIIAKKCGCSDWLTLVIGFLPSMLSGKQISMLVEKLMDVGKVFAGAVVTLTLVLIGELLRKFGGESVWRVLPFYLAPGVLISIATTFIVSYRIKKAKERVARNFEETGGEALADMEIATGGRTPVEAASKSGTFRESI